MWLLRWMVSQREPIDGCNNHRGDSQLYVVVDMNDENSNTDALEKYAAAVNDWMLHNGLALNPDKFEATMFATSRAIASSNIKSITVVGSAITISDKVKSLGVILDKCLPFDSQVKSTYKAIHYQARSLRHIRWSLFDTSSKVCSKLHRCQTRLLQLPSRRDIRCKSW